MGINKTIVFHKQAYCQHNSLVEGSPLVVKRTKLPLADLISIDNSMIRNDIGHKYHE